MAEDKRTRGDRIAEFFGSERLVQVFRPLAEEVFNRGGSPEDLERIGRDQALREILSGHIIMTPEAGFAEKKPWVRSASFTLGHGWLEHDGMVLFPVTSDGTTGPEWVRRLEKEGFRVSDWAKSVLCSPAFQPTSGITTQIAVLPGTLWNDNDRFTRNIRAEAAARKLLSPSAEAACLIREMFSDEEMEAMGLWWIVAMHEPIKDSDGYPDLLSASRYGDGRWLGAYYDRPDDRWDRAGGFAFVVAQVSS